MKVVKETAHSTCNNDRIFSVIFSISVNLIPTMTMHPWLIITELKIDMPTACIVTRSLEGCQVTTCISESLGMTESAVRIFVYSGGPVDRNKSMVWRRCNARAFRCKLARDDNVYHGDASVLISVTSHDRHSVSNHGWLYCLFDSLLC